MGGEERADGGRHRLAPEREMDVRKGAPSLAPPSAEGDPPTVEGYHGHVYVNEAGESEYMVYDPSGRVRVFQCIEDVPKPLWTLFSR